MSCKSEIKVFTEAGVSCEGLTGEESASYLVNTVVDIIQLLMGCESEVLSSSLAVNQRLPSVPCHTNCYTMAAYLSKHGS